MLLQLCWLFVDNFGGIKGALVVRYKVTRLTHDIDLTEDIRGLHRGRIRDIRHCP